MRLILKTVLPLAIVLCGLLVYTIITHPRVGPLQILYRDHYGTWMFLDSEGHSMLIVLTGDAGTMSCTVKPRDGGETIMFKAATGMQSLNIQRRPRDLIVIVPDGRSLRLDSSTIDPRHFADVDSLSPNSPSIADRLREYYKGPERDKLVGLMDQFPLPVNELLHR